MGSPGGFVWYELAAGNVEKAKAFYADAVGWGTSEASMPGPAYTLFTAAGSPVAGLTELRADARSAGIAPQWIGYVGVDDVDATARRAEKLGGTVYVPPTDIPNVSRFSIIADPQNATLALMKWRGAAGQEPAQQESHGRAVWHELLAPNWDKAFKFYNELLGWRNAGVYAGSEGSYLEFSTGGETAAAGGMFTPSQMLAGAFWLYYFHVRDIGAAVKRVTAGGGQILYGPISAPGNARFVQCRDPQGAIFGLIERRLQVAIGCYAPRDLSNKPK